MARILLAEDDDSMRAFLKRALEKGGHDVEAVGDGIDALAALISDRYDLLLADIVMPGLDGIELARRASQDDPAMRVILITGFAAVALRARTEALGRAGAVEADASPRTGRPGRRHSRSLTGPRQADTASRARTLSFGRMMVKDEPSPLADLISNSP
jgi:two-component system, cell cycle response regulator CpdR